MIHRIPAKNWHINLARALEQAEEGDTILVVNSSQKEKAENAKKRMGRDVEIKTIEEI